MALSAAVLIAVKDLKMRLRDRSFFIVGIAAPLILAFIFNAIFGGVADAGSGLDLTYGVVDLDGSAISQTFVSVLEDLEDEGILTIEEFADATEATAAIEEGDVVAYFLIEEGFGSAVTGGKDTTLRVVGDVDAPISTQIAASIAEQFAIGVDATQLALATVADLRGTSLTPDLFRSLSTDPSTAAFSYELIEVPAARRQLDPVTFFAAGMAIFFLFFTVQFGVTGLLDEKRDGTLARLFAAPVPRFSVVLGKALVAFALGIISMGFLIAGTGLIMGAKWGDPLGLALLVVSGVAAAVGVMGLVAAIAKTPEGAGNMGSIIAVVLGMLGGTFFPLGQGEDLLSKLTLITPHAWFMRGVGDLAGGAPWTAALPAAGAMALFAVVCGAVGWVSTRRRLMP